MVSRRRTRTKQKTIRWSDSGESDTGTDEHANVEALQTSTSKVRGKQKAVAKPSNVRITKKGKLGMIAEMPLDVLYEVSPSFPLLSLNAVGFISFAHRYSPSWLPETLSGFRGLIRSSGACSPVAPRGIYGKLRSRPLTDSLRAPLT